MQFQPRPLEPSVLAELRGALLDEREFSRLLNEFVRQAVADNNAYDPDSKRIYRNSLVSIADENARKIAASAQSPIERIFIRSLVLYFLRADGLGLLVHSAKQNTLEEVAEFRCKLARFQGLVDRFSLSGGQNLSQFMHHEAGCGRLTWDERWQLTSLIAYYYAPLDASYHVTLQSCFPDIQVDGKSVRADLYFWIPRYPEIKVIVECDGFEFHSSRERFTNDRQRDRAFDERGFTVHRYSGSEIRNDPVGVAHDLATRLLNRANSVAQAQHSMLERVN